MYVCVIRVREYVRFGIPIKEQTRVEIQTPPSRENNLVDWIGWILFVPL